MGTDNPFDIAEKALTEASRMQREAFLMAIWKPKKTPIQSG